MANPNPDTSGLAPAFAPGQSGNPGGKTSAQRKLEVENAEKATRIRAHLLDREIAAIEDPISGDLAHKVRELLKDTLGDKTIDRVLSALEMDLTAERLKLIKDSEDRGLGAPKQTTEFEGGVSVTQITRRLVE